ncbi:MAG: thiamine pyrophosphate-dependent enzyme, partial [Bdellovibrionaceae bacterium]|nr:thiamine pyrophosphate-dependent enzyme [Pseudobdellovibrionaceae bacterium]
MNTIKINNKLFKNPIKQPLFVREIKNLKNENILLSDPQALRAMIALMDMNAVLGGAASHYGGPAAFAELMSAVHGYMFFQAMKNQKQWHEMFHFVNDAGHCENGLYAIKANYEVAGLNLESLKKFRSINSNLTGHGESHLFPEGVFLSNGPLGSAFPQTVGLALGEKWNQSQRVTLCAISDGACMEGEAKEAFATIPGLAQRKLLAPYVLIISDNNTKLSGRIDKDSFSMQPTFSALALQGWKVISLEQGNDLQSCYQTLEQAVEEATNHPEVPVVIHAKTIKGIGTKKTAESSSGGHGFPLKSPKELSAFLKEIYNGQDYPKIFESWITELIKLEDQIIASGKKDSGEKIQKGVASAMIQAKKKGLPLISVTSDLPGSTGVADFRKEFPESSVDVGIAESQMISAAAGLSKLGFIPIVDTFAQFGVTKGALPLTMASLSEAPIIAVFSHTGFQDAADGASHQALSYIAMVASIPYVEVYCLSCSEEAHELMTKAIEDFHYQRSQGLVCKSKIFFLGRENFPKTFGAKAYQLGKAQVLKTEWQHKNVTLLTTGSLVGIAINAADKLKLNSIG